MRFLFNRVGASLLLSAGLCFAYAGVANHRNVIAVASVEKSLELTRQLESLTTRMLEEESAVRAYILSGNRAFLTHQAASGEGFEATFRTIERLLQNDRTQLERLQRLAHVAKEKHAWMQQTAELRTTARVDEAADVVGSMRGKVLMDEFSAIIAEMNQAQVLQIRTHSATASSARVHTNIGIGLLIVALAFNLWKIRQQAKALNTANERIADSEDHYRALFEHTSELVRLHALDGRTTFVSPSVVRLLGYSVEELTLMSPAALVHPDDLERALENIRQLVEGEIEGAVLSYRLRRKGGDYRWFELHVARVKHRDGSVRHFRSSARDITERLELEEQLSQQAIRDGLTGLYNRRGFMEVSAQALKSARRGQEPMRLLFTDLDGLKRVNDQLGHEAGDRFIKEAASVLRTVCRDSDIVARLGGDEFVILATHCKDADHLLDRLDKAIAEENAKPGRAYELSFSTGLAIYDPARPTSLEELIKLADSRMYEQKVARRRNRSLPAAARESSGRFRTAPLTRVSPEPQHDAAFPNDPNLIGA